ncbi:MAG: SPOR domain-containing protein [Sphingobium sp.]
MMTGTNDSLALDDEDRLPWLEPAYDDEDEGEVSLVRLALFILAGLALLGLIVGGIYLLRSPSGDVDAPEVIAAPKEDYKVPAKDADAKKFQGEGDASFAASEGVERGGKIDPSRLPEAPVTAVAGSGAPEKAVATAASTKVSAPVTDRTGEKAGTSEATSPAKAAGPAIQLGAYGSDAIAREAWGRLSKRFDYLAALPHSIEPVTVGGTKFFRLRAAAGADSGTLCGKLKVAGESCIVVR